MRTLKHYPHGAKKRWTRDLSLWEPYAEAPRMQVGRLATLETLLPLSVALQARNKVYPYPIPTQKRLRGRTIRLALTPPRQPMVRTKVRIRLPRILPRVRGSYVSLRRGVLSVHSKRQLNAALAGGALNTRFYQEHKTNHRKGRHGQLDSPGARAFGSVAEAYRRGWSIGKIADAALVARAVSKTGGRKWR